MRLETGQKLLFIGDSITDCGRAQPAGEGLFGALGNGYVALVDALLQTSYPSLNVRVVNQGTGGNTVRDLAARWERDVVAHRPDWLAVGIGINDVWRRFDSPLVIEGHVGLAEYRETYDRLLAAMRPDLKGLILLSPFLIEPNRDDAMRAEMDAYGAAVRELASRHDAIFVDLQTAFDAATATRHPMSLAWDRVHPNLAGAMTIARAFLEGVEFRYDGERS